MKTTVQNFSAKFGTGLLGALMVLQMSGAALLVPQMASAETGTLTATTQNDDYTVDQGSTLTVSAGDGVLANDHASTSTANLTVSTSSSPSHGTLLAFGAKGSFTYKPDTDFYGMDSFEYTATATLGATTTTDTGSVTITVNALANGKTATLRVCKTLLDTDGNLVTGSSSQHFSIEIDGEESHTVTFGGELDYNMNLYTDITGDDADCETLAVSPGDYTYTEESITNAGNYRTPKYHDSFQGLPNSIDDLGDYNDAQNDPEFDDFDGEITNLGDGETRTLAILNQVRGETPPEDGGSETTETFTLCYCSSDTNDVTVTLDKNWSTEGDTLTNLSGNFTITKVTSGAHEGGYKVTLVSNGADSWQGAKGTITLPAGSTGIQITRVVTGTDKLEDGSDGSHNDTTSLSGNVVTFELAVTTANDVFYVDFDANCDGQGGSGDGEGGSGGPTLCEVVANLPDDFGDFSGIPIGVDLSGLPDFDFLNFGSDFTFTDFLDQLDEGFDLPSGQFANYGELLTTLGEYCVSGTGGGTDDGDNGGGGNDGGNDGDSGGDNGGNDGNDGGSTGDDNDDGNGGFGRGGGAFFPTNDSNDNDDGEILGANTFPGLPFTGEGGGSKHPLVAVGFSIIAILGVLAYFSYKDEVKVKKVK